MLTVKMSKIEIISYRLGFSSYIVDDYNITIYKIHILSLISLFHQKNLSTLTT